MYKVIKEFLDTDKQTYKVGDYYENDDKKRIEVLSTNKNKYGFPFIEKVKATRKKKVQE